VRFLAEYIRAKMASRKRETCQIEPKTYVLFMLELNDKCKIVFKKTIIDYRNTIRTANLGRSQEYIFITNSFVNEFAFIGLPEVAGLDINERGENGGGQCRMYIDGQSCITLVCCMNVGVSVDCSKLSFTIKLLYTILLRCQSKCP